MNPEEIRWSLWRWPCTVVDTILTKTVIRKAIDTPSPDRPGAAMGNLNDLRHALTSRLSALEAALADPAESSSLERLMIDLARVATSEAEASASRAWTEAAAKVRDQAVTLRQTETALESERSSAAALQRDFDRLRAAYETECASVAQLRRDLAAAQAASRGDRDSAAQAAAVISRLQQDLDAVQRAATSRIADLEEATDLFRADAGRHAAELDTLRAELEVSREATAAADAELSASREAAVAAQADAQAHYEARIENERAQLDARLEHEHAQFDARLENERAQHETRLEQAQAQFEKRLEDARVQAEKRLQEARTQSEKRLQEVQAQSEKRLQEAQAQSEKRVQEVQAQSEKHLQEVQGQSEKRFQESEKRRHDAQGQFEKRFQEARAQFEEQLASARGPLDRRVRELELELATVQNAATAKIADVQKAADHVRQEGDRVKNEAERFKSEAERLRGEAEGLTAELEATRAAARAAEAEAQARYEHAREQADRRILDLELEVDERDREVKKRDERISALEAAPPPILEPTFEVADLRASESSPEPEPPADDRPVRRAKRITFEDVEVLVDEGTAILVDLSTCGAQVLSPRALRPNRVLTVQLAGGERPVSAAGAVVWTKLEPREGSLMYRSGMAFLDVDEAAVEEFLTRYGDQAEAIKH
jgi:chromosome segregation ATPase